MGDSRRLLASLACLAGLCAADHYNEGGTDPLCWGSTFANGTFVSTSELVTCPTLLDIRVTTASVTSLEVGKGVDVEYYLDLPFIPTNLSETGLEEVSSRIIHANLHACVFESVGYCSPVSTYKTTDTAALSASTWDSYLPSRGVYHYNFSTAQGADQFKLNTEDAWLVIAHVRFWNADGTILYNVANSWGSQSIKGTSATSRLSPITMSSRIAVITIMVIAELILLVCLILTVVWRNHKVMKISQVSFLQLMIAMAMISCGAAPFTMDTGGDLQCNLQLFLVLIPWTLMFAFLFAKSYRLLNVTNRRSIRVRVMPFRRVLFLALAIVLPQVVLVVVQFILAPMHKARRTSGGDFYFTCTSRKGNIFYYFHIVYVAILLVVGIRLATKMTSMNSLFNESHSIAFSLYTCALLCCMGFVILILVDQNQQVQYVFLVLCVIITAVTTCLALLFHKFLLIIRNVEINISMASEYDKKRATRLRGESVVSDGRLAVSRLNKGMLYLGARGVKACLDVKEASDVAVQRYFQQVPIVEDDMIELIESVQMLHTELQELRPDLYSVDISSLQKQDRHELEYTSSVELQQTKASPSQIAPELGEDTPKTRQKSNSGTELPVLGTQLDP